MLSTTAPLQRGDDVAELQERLAALGFDPGRVDGIFGARTRAAVAGFQSDAGLPSDGVCGPATLSELRRLAPLHADHTLVSEVKERSRLSGSPAGLGELVVALGQGGGLEALVEATARAVRAKGARPLIVRDHDEVPIAASANAAHAGCLVVLRVDPAAAHATGLYFESDRSVSPAGRRLAEVLSDRAGRALGVEGGTRGMTLPVLRESAMPTTVLEAGPLARLVERTGELAEAVACAVERWVATPV